MVYVLSYVYFLAAILCFIVPVPVSSAPLLNISRIDTSSAEYSAPGPRRSAESTTIKFQQNLKLSSKHYGVNHARYGVNAITNNKSNITERTDVQQSDQYHSISSDSTRTENALYNNSNLDYNVVDVGLNFSTDINAFIENTTSVSSTIERGKREVNQNKQNDLKTRNNKNSQYHHPRRRHRHHFHHQHNKIETTNSVQVPIDETSSTSLNVIVDEEITRSNTSTEYFSNDNGDGNRTNDDSKTSQNHNRTGFISKSNTFSGNESFNKNNESRGSHIHSDGAEDYRNEVKVDVDSQLEITVSNSTKKYTEHVSDSRTVDVVHTHTANTGIEDDNVDVVNQTRIRASRETSSGNSAGPDEHELDENTGRNERSTNLSHITGTERKINMYIMNKFLQILPDGTVNGGETDNSNYTIFQRISIQPGQVKIYGVTTCQFVCMDECGLLYGSREFNENCVFNETYRENKCNAYISTRHSNKNRVMYLALDKYGESRKVQVKSIHTSLGKMASYTSLLTKSASDELINNLDSKVLCTMHDSQISTPKPIQVTQHPVRHQHGMQTNHGSSSTDGSSDVKKFRCRKRRKRKNNRKKVKNEKSDKNRHEKSIDGNAEPQHRKHLQTSSNSTNNSKKKKLKSQTTCTLVNSDSEKCISVDRNKNIIRQFIFNGVPHRDCDEYKNVNKKKKCELAQKRQRTKNADVSNGKMSTKINFQAGEVDATKLEKSVKQTEEQPINRPALKSLNQNAAGSELEQRTSNEMTNRDGDSVREASLSNSNIQNTPSQVFGDGSSSPSWSIDGGTVDDDIQSADNVDQFLEEEYDWMPGDELGRDDFVERSDTTTSMSTLPDSIFSVSPPPDNLNDDYGSSMLDDV